MKIIKKVIYILIMAIIGTIINTGYTQAATGTGFGYNGYISGYQVPGAAQGTFSDNNDELLNVIQRTINRVLGMLSLIALVLCLRGGFQMLTAGSDDSKVKSGGKILKNAAIGLAIVGLSWLIVSFIFRIIGKVTGS